MPQIQCEKLALLPNDGNGERVERDQHLFFVDDMTEMGSKAIFTSKDYVRIFGQRKKESPDHRKRLPIVKISANGKSIHREYVQINHMIANHVGLTYRSLSLLEDADGNKPSVLTIEPGNWFMFYWDHPNHAARISMRFGVISICVGVLPELVSIFRIILSFFC